jgi:hypothetical protein
MDENVNLELIPGAAYALLKAINESIASFTPQELEFIDQIKEELNSQLDQA